MPDIYLISSTYREAPGPGKNAAATINQSVAPNVAVGSLMTQINRNHLAPGSVDKLFIAAENKKGEIILGLGLTVSNVKALEPIRPFLKPGRDRVGVELLGFKISNEVANRDLAQAIAGVLAVSVLADGETFTPKRRS